MTDLIERLRSLGKTHDDMSVGAEAADEIVRLLDRLEWVGLTADEVNAWELPDRPTVFEFVQFIESKLKAKSVTAKRKWVGLTDEEIREVYTNVRGKEWCLGGLDNAEVFYDTIETKLKEKNNGTTN